MDPRSAHLRLSDAEREEALALLGEHYASGRLDKDEYDERSDAVWSARTRADLRPVFADLPRPERPRPAPRRRVPFVPVLVALGAILVLTHLPLVLLGLLVWFLVCRHGFGHRRRTSALPFPQVGGGWGTGRGYSRGSWRR